MRAPLLILLACAALAGCASSGTGPRSVGPAAAGPPTAAQIASARTEADALLRSQNAADIFANVTGGGVPELRHTRSGLVCGFASGSPLNRILVYPSGPRGDDVSCGTEELAFSFTTYATRNSSGSTLEQEIQGAVVAIRARWPDARPYEGPGMSMELQPRDGEPARPLPQRATARLVVGSGARAQLTRVSVTLLNGWIVKQRMTGPLSEAMTGELMAELFMTSALTRMTETPGTAPATISPPPI